MRRHEDRTMLWHLSGCDIKAAAPTHKQQSAVWLDPDQLTGTSFHAFRTLLRWATPLLLLLGQKTAVWTEAQSSKSISKIQTTTNSHRSSEWGCETHLSTETSVLWPGSEPDHLCAHTHREAVLQHVEETDWRDSGNSEGSEETLDSCRVSVATSSSQTHLHSHYHGAETSPDTSATRRYANRVGARFVFSSNTRVLLLVTTAAS